MKRVLLSLALAAAALMAAPAAFAASDAPSQTPAPTPTPSPTPAPTPALPPAKLVRARLLRDCSHGKADDLVSIPADVAKAEEKAGVLDTHKDAVAYAASLPQNQPKPEPEN